MFNRKPTTTLKQIRKNNLSQVVHELRMSFSIAEAVNISAGHDRTPQATYKEFFRQLSSHLEDIVNRHPFLKDDEFYSLVAKNIEPIFKSMEMPTVAMSRGELYGSPSEISSIKNHLHHLDDLLNADFFEMPQGNLTYEKFAELVSVKADYFKHGNWHDNPQQWNARRFEQAVRDAHCDPIQWGTTEPTFNDITSHELFKLKQAFKVDEFEHVSLWKSAKGNFTEYMKLYEDRILNHLPSSHKDQFLEDFKEDLLNAVMPTLKNQPLPTDDNEAFASLKAELATQATYQRLLEFLEEKRKEASYKTRTGLEERRRALENDWVNEALNNIEGVIVEVKIQKVDAVMKERNRAIPIFEGKKAPAEMKEFFDTMPANDEEALERMVQKIKDERVPSLEERRISLEMRQDRPLRLALRKKVVEQPSKFKGAPKKKASKKKSR